MLLNLVKGCNSLSKAISLRTDDVKIDNVIDSGHKIVSIFLGISFIIVTASRYAVDPIRCSPGVVLPGVIWPTSMIENYCYMGKTFVLAYRPNKVSKAEKNVLDDTDLSLTRRWLKKSQKNKKIYQTLYYWMQYIILLQAFSFIIPKFFWKTFERGKLKNFTSLLSRYKEQKDKRNIFKDSDEEEQHLKKIVIKDKEEEERGIEKDINGENCIHTVAIRWFWKQNFGQLNCYFFLYFISEILYFVNVAAQYYFVDFLLNHMLYQDAWALIKETFDIGDPHFDYYFRFTFPVVTMCELPMFDSNSNPIRSTLTCVLTLNYLYRKIVLISWILFSILGVLNCLNILFCIFIALGPKVLKSKILRSCYNIENNDDVEQFFTQDMRSGDWFFLYMLKQNWDPVTEVQFRKFVLKECIENGS